MALYIKWREVEAEFTGWTNAYGEPTPNFRPKYIWKKARFSTDDTPELRQRAQEWITTQRPDAKLTAIPD